MHRGNVYAEMQNFLKYLLFSLQRHFEPVTEVDN
jgi:hypothetical protein